MLLFLLYYRFLIRVGSSRPSSSLTKKWRNKYLYLVSPVLSLSISRNFKIITLAGDSSLPAQNGRNVEEIKYLILYFIYSVSPYRISICFHQHNITKYHIHNIKFIEIIFIPTICLKFQIGAWILLLNALLCFALIQLEKRLCLILKRL
jgi:hypothetical protein